MLSDQELIELMVSEPSWEDVVVKIVAEENIDPWNIDLGKLADAFTSYVAKMEDMDLRVPARFVLIAAILLRMKSDILAGKREKLIQETSKTPSEREAELIKVLSSIPPLQPPVKRVPLGAVTMEELITALRKAFEVQERRKKRKERIRQRVEAVLPREQEDITQRIENLLEEINRAIESIEGSTTFSRLVKSWERKTIVRTLMPMLHLTQEGKITYEQSELFKDIIVKKKHKKEETK